LTIQKYYSLVPLDFSRKSCENQLFSFVMTVKIVAQNKKDGKGREINFPNKKILPPKIQLRILLFGHF
jgi:hypothetical protein